MRQPCLSIALRLMQALLATALLAACSKPAAEAPTLRPVVVEHPQPMVGAAGEVFPGSVRAREEADLSFRVAGKILQRRVDAGAEVKAGQVLATLDPADARLNTDAAKATLAAAEADVKLADADLRRHKELLDKGFISKSLYELRENTLQLAQARADQARSNLAVVANQSSYTTLTATKAGLITAVLAEAGQVVAAGQPVLRFAASGEREASISVPEGRIEALRAAPELGIALWAKPGKVYKGKLRFINLQADASTRTHDARVTIVDADDDVQLGMTVTAYLGARMDATLFRVPLSALAQVDGKPVVWIVAGGGKAHKLAVTVARYVEGFAIVGGALTPDMQLVSAGVQLLGEDQVVKAIARHAEADAS